MIYLRHRLKKANFFGKVSSPKYKVLSFKSLFRRGKRSVYIPLLSDSSYGLVTCWYEIYQYNNTIMQTQTHNYVYIIRESPFAIYGNCKLAVGNWFRLRGNKSHKLYQSHIDEAGLAAKSIHFVFKSTWNLPLPLWVSTLLFQVVKGCCIFLLEDN